MDAGSNFSFFLRKLSADIEDIFVPSRLFSLVHELFAKIRFLILYGNLNNR